MRQKQRAGLWKCKGCDEQFTVTIGTIFEGSHVPLNKWVLAFQLMVASKKGMAAHQLLRMLDVTYKTAWFMAHRIRHALTIVPTLRSYTASSLRTVVRRALGQLPIPELGWSRGHETMVSKLDAV